MKARCVKLPGPYATVYVSDTAEDRVAEHQHEYAHACTVIFGAVRVVIDGRETHLVSGQSVIFPAGSLHSIHPTEIGTVFVNSSASVLPSEEEMFAAVESAA
jgi:quercetin dioxygenase-like cupin family protein